jgi:hypothetical protein
MKHSIAITLIIATTLILLSCKKENNSNPGSMQLSSCYIGTTILNYPGSTTDVPFDKDLIINFSAAIDSVSALNTIKIKKNTTEIKYGISFTNDHKTIVLKPEQALEEVTAYMLDIQSSLRGKNGETFSGIQFVFTTAKTDLTLQTLVAGDIDLNGPIAPTTVLVAPTIVASFSTDVDATSATSNSITLTRDYDNATVPTTVTVAGSKITIVPTEALATGALFKLNFAGTIKSTDGELLTPIERNFTTIGTFAPSGQIAWWNFEGDAKDQVGSFDASTALSVNYTASHSTAAGKAASFNGTTSIIEIPNGDKLLTPDFTLSFWVKAETQNKGHFVMGLGAFYGFFFEIAGDFTNCKLAGGYSYQGGGDTAIFCDNWWHGDGKNKDNGGWQGCTLNKDMTGSGGIQSLLKDKWAHVVCTFDHTTRVATIYMNGEAVKAQDYNLWPTTDKLVKVTGMLYGGKAPDVVNELAFGFIQSRAGTMWDTEPWGGYGFPEANHFKGQLDDVRIFNKSITATEVDLIYKSEKL